jgi:L-threonylcarbamoyladenylate synthase
MAKKIKIAELVNIDKHPQEAVTQASKLFYEGKVFVYPTDTIYGFGANPFNSDPVDKIGKIKGRDAEKKYILLINNIDLLLKHVEIHSENHIDFLLSIWPNPISVILPLRTNTKKLLKSDTAAFRIPNNRFCINLIEEINSPLISTSVNRSGLPPLKQYGEIIEQFSTEVDGIFFTEKKSYVESSTLIDLSNHEPKLLREGKMKFDDIVETYQLLNK